MQINNPGRVEAEGTSLFAVDLLNNEPIVLEVTTYPQIFQHRWRAKLTCRVS